MYSTYVDKWWALKIYNVLYWEMSLSINRFFFWLKIEINSVSNAVLIFICGITYESAKWQRQWFWPKKKTFFSIWVSIKLNCHKSPCSMYDFCVFQFSSLSQICCFKDFPHREVTFLANIWLYDPNKSFCETWTWEKPKQSERFHQSQLRVGLFGKAEQERKMSMHQSVWLYLS